MHNSCTTSIDRTRTLNLYVLIAYIDYSWMMVSSLLLVAIHDRNGQSTTTNELISEEISMAIWFSEVCTDRHGSFNNDYECYYHITSKERKSFHVIYIFPMTNWVLHWDVCPRLNSGDLVRKWMTRLLMYLSSISEKPAEKEMWLSYVDWHCPAMFLWRFCLWTSPSSFHLLAVLRPPTSMHGKWNMINLICNSTHCNL